MANDIFNSFISKFQKVALEQLNTFFKGDSPWVKSIPTATQVLTDSLRKKILKGTELILILLAFLLYHSEMKIKDIFACRRNRNYLLFSDHQTLSKFSS